MRPRVARLLVAIAAAPSKPPEPEPPIDPMDFARSLVDVANRQSPEHRRAMADAFGSVIADRLATAYRPEGVP